MSCKPFHVALLMVCVALFGCKKPDVTPVEQPAAAGPVAVRILAINDLHGHLEAPSSPLSHGDQKVDAGGVDAMAAHLNALREGHEHTAFVCAGDLIGASPLLSALFHDEPTIEAMNLLGLDALAVGNHEFDDGVEELLRLKQGGCHPEFGCQGKEAYTGAEFPFLAANVRVRESGETLFPAYVIREYGGVRVGFIGLTLEGTDKMVSPEAVRAVEFLNEAETINANVKLLQAQGIEAIVVIIHEGAVLTEDTGDINGCGGVEGPLVAINAALDPAVDVVIAGHTHRYFNCTLEGRLLTSAKDYGRMITAIDLTLDPRTGDVLTKQANNVIVTRDDVTPEPQLVSHLDHYRALVGPLASRPVGTIAADLPRAADAAGNSPLGQLIADSQLAATQPVELGGAQLALMNMGGVRAALVMKPVGEEPEGVITFEELHAVQPFGNTLTVIELTGAQIEALLEEQRYNPDNLRLLQPSSNFSYTWRTAPEGDPIDPALLLLNGSPLDPLKTYRVTVNSFLATGGDGYTILPQGKMVAGGALDLDAFVTFVGLNNPLVPPMSPRIKRQ